MKHETPPSTPPATDSTASRTPSPGPSPKKRKAAPKGNVPSYASPSKAEGSKISPLSDARARLAEEIVLLGIAAVQANAAAVVKKLQNQLRAGRANVRKSLLEAAKSV